MKLIFKMVTCVVISLLIISAKVSTAEAPTYKHKDLIPKTIPELVTFYSKKYTVSEIVMNKVINCESGFNPKAHALTSREDSWGLVQINRLAHPYVSIEQATDPEFAINFLAENLAKGKGRMWTCYRKL